MTYFTQLKKITLVAILTSITLSAFNVTIENEYLSTSSSNPCASKSSSFDIVKIDQLCQQTSMANKSWLLWLSGESQSTYLHFLDLVELLHYTLD